MRAPLLCLAWVHCAVGCGPVRLGDEVTLPTSTSTPAPTHTHDAGASSVAISAELDAAVAPSVVVNVSASGDCDVCYKLSAEVAGGQPPYTFEWQDGSREAARTVCSDQIVGPLTLVVRDANGETSEPNTTELAQSDASCPAAPVSTLCLQNPSFEGTAAYNTGGAGEFDAAPWSECINPTATNTPDIISDTGMQSALMPAPKPTDGLTYLGLTEDEQASQALCEPISAGSTVNLQLDLFQLDLTVGGSVPDTEQAFVELWGGRASDCVARELLWKSPALQHAWKTFCVSLSPQQLMDNLIVRGTSDGSLPTPTYVLVDHLVRVSQCP